MRVMLTTDTVGGVWTFTSELSQGLLAAGHKVALLSFGPPPSAHHLAGVAEISAAHGSAFRFEAADVPLEWMQDNAKAWEHAAHAVNSLQREFEAHVLHANQFCLGSFGQNLPTVLTAHSDVLSWAETCAPQGLPGAPWLDRYVKLVDDGLRDADVIAAPTRWMADTLERLYPGASSHFDCDDEPLAMHVVPNGRSLPQSQIGPDARDSADQRLLQAVSAGRLWDKAKGLDVLSDLDAPFPVLLAGDASHPDSYGNAPALAGCELVGALSAKELFALFRRSSLYLATSIYEPFGLAPLEAALCGCAVIARDIASLREVWQEGALYFSTQASLRKILENLAGSPERLRAAQARSLARARHFTREAMTRGYVALYESALWSNGFEADGSDFLEPDTEPHAV